jgi:hypothetical protein
MPDPASAFHRQLFLRADADAQDLRDEDSKVLLSKATTSSQES